MQTFHQIFATTNRRVFSVEMGGGEEKEADTFSLPCAYKKF